MSNCKLLNLFGIAVATLCLIAIPFQSQAANKGKTKTAQPTKERLVLMPLRVGEDERNMLASMETALVQGLQQKYEVFSGEQVAQKAKEIFNKESHSAKKDCDETRCMQGIAEAFQAELIATANVTKIEGGYLLALSIQNIFDNKVVYSNSLPCKNCDAFQVVDKLKELSGSSVQATSQETSSATGNIEPAIIPSGNPNDPENALWAEVQKGNSVDDYGAYLAQYPKGKYVALAKTRLNKLKEQEAAETRRQKEQAATELAQQEQSAWDSANGGASEDSYQGYLNTYPQGRYAALATARIAKLKKDAAEAAAKGPQPGQTFRDCPDCPEMVVIPQGSFDMGSDNGDSDEKPIHRVTLGKAFALGKTEVTQGQWKAIMGNNPSNYGNCGDNCPVEQVSWNDAKGFIQKLNAKTGKQYRLPSEAEWEYACRAGGQQEYCGSDDVYSVAWNYDNSRSTTHTVATKQANAFGLFDMSGNVWEWVEDSYHDNYNGAPVDGTAWQGGGAQRVLRGGSVNLKPWKARAAKRSGTDPRGGCLGFRLTRTLP